FSPAMASTWIWVPRHTGRSTPYDAAEIDKGLVLKERPRRDKTGPAAIRLAAAPASQFGADLPRALAARICIYYEGNLIQSASVHVAASMDGRQNRLLKIKNEIRVDYALSNSLQDLDKRYGRRTVSLAGSKDGEKHPVRVNIALNDDGL